MSELVRAPHNPEINTIASSGPCVDLGKRLVILELNLLLKNHGALRISDSTRAAKVPCQNSQECGYPVSARRLHEVCLCVDDLITGLLRIASLFKVARQEPLLFMQIVFFQEFGPERLWRSRNVWSTLWRKVHEIPIRPHRVHVIR